MVQIIKATACGSSDGLPEGFRFLVNEDMSLVEEANLYLYETCIVNGSVSSQETQRTYTEHLYDWFQSCEDNGWDWKAITRHEIALYRNRMLEHVSPATGRPYKPGTINDRLGTIFRFYSSAKALGHIAALPFKLSQEITSVRRSSVGATQYKPRRAQRTNRMFLRERSPTATALTPQQLGRILNHLSPPSERPSRDRLMCEVAVTTGLRRMEVCALGIDQVLNAQPGKSLTRIIVTTTKGRVERAIYIPEKLMNRLRWYVTLDRASVLQSSGKREATQNIFITNQGNPIKPTYLTKIFKKAAKSAVISDATFHSLRHTFALNFYKGLQILGEKEPWKMLQIVLGHASMGTTIDIYLRSLQPNEAVLSDSIEAIYDQALGDYAND